MVYPSLVCCEALPMLDYGRGTQNVFRIVAAPWLRAEELKKMLGNVTNTALTNALRELEENELIHREQFNEIPPHVEYSLTDKGKDLLPVFHAIANWGLKYIS